MYLPKILACDDKTVYKFLFLSRVVLKWGKGNEWQEELLWSVTEQNTGTLYQKPVRNIKARKAVELSENIKDSKRCAFINGHEIIFFSRQIK